MLWWSSHDVCHPGESGFQHPFLFLSQRAVNEKCFLGNLSVRQKKKELRLFSAYACSMLPGGHLPGEACGLGNVVFNDLWNIPKILFEQGLLIVPVLKNLPACSTACQCICQATPTSNVSPGTGRLVIWLH